MVRIIIYESTTQAQNVLKAYLQEFFEAHHFSYSITDFQDISKESRFFFEYDVLFMEMELFEEDGICLAKRIREYNKDLLILFVIDNKERIIEGYEVDAKRVFLKPLEKNNFYTHLYDVCRTYFKQHFGIWDPRIAPHRIYYKDILYVEYYCHRSILRYRSKGEIVTPYPLKYWAKELSGAGFVQPYQSFVVNPEAIEDYDTKARTIIMSNGERIPVSRKYKKTFEQRYYSKDGF